MTECAATQSQLSISSEKAMEFLPVEQRKSKKCRLTIEDYIEFHSSDKKLDLTVFHLNQIMTMHGLKMLKGSKKDAKVEAMRLTDLIDPERSTLKDDSISSKAFLTAKEVLTDLSKLHWQECCITSILTLNSLNYEQKSADDSSTSGSTKPKAANSGSTGSRRKKKKKRSIENSIDFPSITADSSSELITHDLASRKKKKRSIENSIDFPSITADSSSELITHDSASKSSKGGGGSGPSLSETTELG